MKCDWVMMLFLHYALSEKFEVVGPDAPVVATAGSDVILPCSVRWLEGHTNMSAVNMSIKWTRPDLGDTLVHFYANHEDINTQQSLSYIGRSALFKDELLKGNASLRLAKVRVSDQGQYKCFVESERWHDDASFNVKVEAVGSHPVITVERYDDDSKEFSLLCESKGWFPQPDLQWLNSKGNNLTAGVTESQRDAELFSVKRSITVHHRDTDSVFCIVTLRHHIMEEPIKPSIIYDYLPKPSQTAGIVVGVLTVILLIVIVAGVVFYKYKERQRKEEERQERERQRKEEERQERERPEKEELNKVINALKPEEMQCEDSSVEKGLLSDLRKVSLQELREKLQRILESRSKVELRGKGLTEKSCAVLASALSSENSKLTELDLSENELQNSGVEKLCEGLKSPNCKLKTLSLISCSFMKESCADLASVLSLKNSPLRELDLTDNELLDLGVKELSVGLRSPDCKLERLRLADCRLVDGCADLIKALKENPSRLIELNLNNNNPRDSAVKELCELLKKKECRLEKLELASCRILDEDCAALVEALKENPTQLKELNLNENNLRDSGVEKLCDLLKKKECRLEKLQLATCSIEKEGCDALIGALLSHSSQLTELNLGNNNLGDSALKKLSALLKDPRCKLQTLELLWCRITDEGCAVLFDALKSNPPSQLKELNLSGNKPSDSAVEALCKLLMDKDCKLERLELEYCSITDKGCADLINAVNPSLRKSLRLNLNNNKAGDLAEEALRSTEGSAL